MPRKRYSTEQIVMKLRQAEVELGRGLRTPQVCKKLGISEQTYSRWRKEYGGLRCDQAKRLKALEHENTRLKRLVADQALDNAILKERGCLGKLLSPPRRRQAVHHVCARLGVSDARPGAAGRAPRVRAAGRVGAAGMSRPRARAVDASTSTAGARRRTAAGGADHRVGDGVWAVRVSADHRAAPLGRLDSESQTSRAPVAARGVERAAATAETRPVVAHGGLLCSLPSHASPPRVGL